MRRKTEGRFVGKSLHPSAFASACLPLKFFPWATSAREDAIAITVTVFGLNPAPTEINSKGNSDLTCSQLASCFEKKYSNISYYFK